MIFDIMSLTKTLIYLQFYLPVLLTMSFLLTLGLTKPINEGGDFLVVQDANLDLEENESTEQNFEIEQPEDPETDDLDTAQFVFKPLFRYRKQTANKFNNRRYDSNKSYYQMPYGKICPYHYYYY